jgi:acyl-coenzyme A thioesterase PaaI-like protein
MIDPARIAHQSWDLTPLPSDPRPGTRPLEQTALGALGIELLRCDPEAVVLRVELPIVGAGAAGILLVAAESAASTAANLRCAPGDRAFGAELDAALLEQEPRAHGAALVVATELAIGDTLQTWRVTAYSRAGDALLEGRCTLGVVAAPD